MTDSRSVSIWTSNFYSRSQLTGFLRYNFKGIAMNYFTVSEPATASFTEKRSEFIGYISPVKTNEEAVEFVNSIKAQHRKAKHNVYAYILRDNNISRYSDDGEPQGTAGVPVLDVLQKRSLTDICMVVTRYFGGTLLGGGGLVRAYSHAASLACDAAHIMDMRLCRKLRITAEYTMYGKISYILPNYNTITVNSDFGQAVSLEILALSENLQVLTKEITDVSNGTALIEDLGEMYQDFSSIK